MKSIFDKTRQMVGKASKVILPILAYGTYAYFMQKNQDVVYSFEFPNMRFSSLYSRAAEAISNSDMSSYDKSAAIRYMLTDGDNAYYEAVISIANSTMSSYDKKHAISNLKV